MESSTLKRLAQEQGFDLVGICRSQTPPHLKEYVDWVQSGQNGSMSYLERHIEQKGDPDSLLPGCKSIFMVALNYYQPNSSDPKIAKYALGRDYHKVIQKKLRNITKALPASWNTRICVDSAPLMERDFAQLAGLGWYGKNTMIINSARGSWFLLGSLLIDQELEYDDPAVGGCGTCTACIDACPTVAIHFEKERWQVDATRCVSYLTIEEKEENFDLEGELGGWLFGCDVCQDVCPFNQVRSSQPLRSSMTLEPDFLEWSVLAGRTHEVIASLTHGEWDQASAGSPIRRAGYQKLIRRAEVLTRRNNSL